MRSDSEILSLLRQYREAKKQIDVYLGWIEQIKNAPIKKSDNSMLLPSKTTSESLNELH